MPLRTNCANCGYVKEPVDYSEYYCSGCRQTETAARELARKEGHDEAAASRQALAGCAHNTGRNRLDPRDAFDRIQTHDLAERLKIESGSVEDPTRGTLK